MQESAQERILDRSEAEKIINDNFLAHVELLKDMTNYGSNLIVRCFNSSDKGIADIIVCAVLLKQVVAMIDAAQELIERGIVHAAFLQSRAAFEASIYIDFILFSDNEKKATSYLVANYRQERLWAYRAIKGSPQEASFHQVSENLVLDMHTRNPTLEQDAHKHLEDVNKILSQSEFKDVDLAFDTYKGKRSCDVEWYALHGMKSIRGIAKAVGRLPEYEIFYSKGSQVTHVGSYKDHIKFMDKKVVLKQIRNLEGIKILINSCATTAIRSYQSVLHNYRTGELAAFARKYQMDWQKAFLNIKDVKYTY